MEFFREAQKLYIANLKPNDFRIVLTMLNLATVMMRLNKFK